MKEVIIAACGGASVSGCFALLAQILNRRAIKKAGKKGVGAGVQILLYDRIKHLCKKYIALGSIPSEELEDLMRMHKIYHDELNGNGYLDTLMSAVKCLKKT